VSAQQTTRAQRWKVLRRSATFWVGGSLVLMWVVFSIFGDFVTGYDPLGRPQDVINRLQPPSAEHWFGTDALGRDVLSRVLAGARPVLTVSLAATLLGTIAGTILGLLTGYFSGIFDDMMSRILDAFLSIPLVITGMLAIAALGATTVGVIVVIGLVFTPLIAKTVRAAVLAERRLDYVTAAHLRRDNPFYILFVEILPNVSGVIVVEFTVRLGYAIFTVLALAFLGFGVEPAVPDWGLAIAQHRGFLVGDIWWPVFFPSLAIASLVVGVNLFADAISQAMEQ
jgi:peptide/nickel transport system permease protein